MAQEFHVTSPCKRAHPVRQALAQNEIERRPHAAALNDQRPHRSLCGLFLQLDHEYAECFRAAGSARASPTGALASLRCHVSRQILNLLFGRIDIEAHILVTLICQDRQFLEIGGGLPKHSGEQCRKPAMRGKAVCRTHGGASTGPKTQKGRKRCARAKTVHGWETREIRRKRADKLRELRQLEQDMKAIGLIDTP